jgi:single-strand DNA-binding protein
MEITGRLVADATVRKTKSDKALTGFRVVVNRTYKQDGERRQQTTYIDCAYWRGTNIAPYLTKGLLVQLSGSMSAKAWVSRDGELMAGLQFNASEINLLGASRGAQEAEQSRSTLKRQR